MRVSISVVLLAGSMMMGAQTPNVPPADKPIIVVVREPQRTGMLTRIVAEQIAPARLFDAPPNGNSQYPGPGPTKLAPDQVAKMWPQIERGLSISCGQSNFERDLLRSVCEVNATGLEPATCEFPSWECPDFYDETQFYQSVLIIDRNTCPRAWAPGQIDIAGLRAIRLAGTILGIHLQSSL